MFAVLLQISLSTYDAVCLIGTVRDFVVNFSAFDTVTLILEHYN